MISDLPNLGPKSAQLLRHAGIESVEQLRLMGPVASFLAVRRTGARPSLNLLWALAGALSDRHWQDISAAEKTTLLAELESE